VRRGMPCTRHRPRDVRIAVSVSGMSFRAPSRRNIVSAHLAALLDHAMPCRPPPDCSGIAELRPRLIRMALVFWPRVSV